jgi:hypothetical protein
MKELSNGTLFYNYDNDRIDVRYSDGTAEGGLHCGQTMEVYLKGEWKPTRLEMSDDWYLVGIKGLESLEGLKVRL